MYYNGSSLPYWSNLLKACAMTETGGVFTPTSDPVNTVTIGSYLPGRALFMFGAMGSFVIEAVRAKPAMIKWSFLGVFDEPTQATLSTPTYDTISGFRAAATFTIGSAAMIVPQVVFDRGAETFLREDVTAVDSAGELTGYRAASISDANPRVRVEREALGLSVQDVYDLWRSKTTQALSLVLENADGDSITLACPKLQLAALPRVGTRNKMMTDVLEFMPLRNTDAGENSFSITFAPAA
jgi:hypothetical protein